VERRTTKLAGSACPAFEGALFGAGLLGAEGGAVLALLGLAAFLHRTRVASRWLAPSGVFALGAGLTSGFWVVPALEGLGATFVQSLVGLGVAVLWCAVPHLVPVAALVRATRSMPAAAALFVNATGAGLWEEVLSLTPGAVPWTRFGHVAIDLSGVAQLAGLGSVAWVSGAVVFFADASSRVASPRLGERDRAAVVASLSSFAALVCGSEWPARVITPEPSIGSPRFDLLAIQPNLPRSERFRPSLAAANVERMARYTERRITASARRPRVVVWPENAIADLGSPVRHDRAAPCPACDALTVAARLGVTLVVGIAERVPGDGASRRVTNRAVSASPSRAALASVDKARTVPVVESRVGILGETLTRGIGLAGIGPLVRPASRARPLGDETGIVPLLCFEALFPRIARARRSEGAAILVNLADDSWVETPWAGHQLTRIARFRAIEQRLPLVRVAHGGRSSAYDAFGREFIRLDEDAWGSMLLELAPRPRPGPERWSLLALPLATCAITFAGARSVARRRRRALTTRSAAKAATSGDP